MLKCSNINKYLFKIINYMILLFFIGNCFFPMYCSGSELNYYKEVGENKKVDVNCDINDLEYIYDPFFIYGSIRNLTIKYGDVIELRFIAKRVFVRSVFWSYFGPHAHEEWIYNEKVRLIIDYGFIFPLYRGIITENFILGMHPIYPFYNLCSSD